MSEAMLCPSCSCDNLPGSEHCRNCLLDLTHLDRPTAQDRVERSLMEDPVAALKPQTPSHLPPTATVGDALRLLVGHDIGAVLVVEGEQVVGIFTERDLLTRLVDVPDRDAQPLGAWMTRDPETVRENDTLALALHKMDSGGYRHLPVVQDGRPVGMISVRDLLRHVTRLCGQR